MTQPHENAFPYTMSDTGEFQAFPGLTKREYFAALAMQRLLAGDADSYNFPTSETVARSAIAAADALIAALQSE